MGRGDRQRCLSHKFWRWSGVIVALFLLTACQAVQLSIYQSLDWEFAYPPAWIPVENPGLATVAFRDPLSPDRNLSLIVSSVPKTSRLADLGNPTQVGYILQKDWLNQPDRGRHVELLTAESLDTALGPEYLLEFAVQLGEQSRHDLAAIALGQGQLYTLVLSLPVTEFDRQPHLYRRLIRSFRLLALRDRSTTMLDPAAETQLNQLAIAPPLSAA